MKNHKANIKFPQGNAHRNIKYKYSTKDYSSYSQYHMISSCCHYSGNVAHNTICIDYMRIHYMSNMMDDMLNTPPDSKNNYRNNWDNYWEEILHMNCRWYHTLSKFTIHLVWIGAFLMDKWWNSYIRSCISLSHIRNNLLRLLHMTGIVHRTACIDLECLVWPNC